MNEGIANMFYTGAIISIALVLHSGRKLEAVDIIAIVICGCIIGWFWTMEVIKQNRRDNRKYRAKSKRRRNHK